MSVERLLIVPDTHAPYHDVRAWGLMMKAARSFKPDHIIHLGDIADFYTVSAHSKDPSRASSLRDEIVEVRKLRAQLESLGASKLTFITGNHEDRLRRYLQDKAPELFGLVSVDELLELSKHGWKVVPYKSYARVGKVRFTHDTGTSGKYSTMRALEDFQHSVVIGHHHAIQYYVGGDATGQVQIGAQFGWLGDVSKIDYLHKIKAQRQWALGFGVGYHHRSSGLVYLVPVPIVANSCCVEGKIHR